MSSLKDFDSDTCYKFTSYFYSFLIALLIISNFGLAIADIIIASKWTTCHLENVDDFLYSSGSVYIVFIVFGLMSVKKESLIYNISYLAGIGSFGILIWGMVIFYDSQEGDCRHKYYQYAYYRTMVIMFAFVGIISSGLLFIACAFIYEKMVKVPLTIRLSPEFVKNILQVSKHLDNHLTKDSNQEKQLTTTDSNQEKQFPSISVIV
jgi:hypothetical protein